MQFQNDKNIDIFLFFFTIQEIEIKQFRLNNFIKNSLVWNYKYIHNKIV